MQTLDDLLAFARAQVQKPTTPETVPKNTRKRVGVSQTDKNGIFGDVNHRAENNHEAQFRAWIDSLEPMPKRALSPLLPEEDQHLRDFIRKKLTAHQSGRLSGSDLWALQALYEGESGFCFNMWPDCFSAHVARAMGACEMTDGNGQAWLVGVICR